MLERVKTREASKYAFAKAAPKGSKTSTSTPKAVSPAPVSISLEERAYYLWEKEGRPENKALEFWLRAEKEFLSNKSPKA